jgi:hypothetical protein
MGAHSGSRTIGNNLYSFTFTTNGLQLYFDAGRSNSYPGTGTVITDISGNNNSGDLLNGTTYSSLDNGRFNFDGTNDTIDINNTISLPTDFSVETFFFLTSTATNYRILFNVGAFQIRFGDGGFGNRLQFGVNMNTVAECWNINLIKNTAFNTWRHILWTRENGVNKMYLAGVQENLSQGTSSSFTFSSFTDSRSITMTGGSTYWGGGGNYFIGSMSMLRIYNRALTQQEITTNYNQLRGRYGV